MHLLLLVAIVLALPACKKKRRESTDDLLAKMMSFRDQMCACKDKACADKVQEVMTTWSTEQARSAGDKRPERPTEAQMKKMTEIGEQYGTCMMKATGVTRTGVGNALPASGDSASGDADRMVTSVFAGTPAGHVVSELKISYVRAHGGVDPTHGRIHVQFGKARKPSPPDDPARAIGAPVPTDNSAADDMLAKCPQVIYEGSARSDGEGMCFTPGNGLTRPNCSVTQVWKQAIVAGAPAEALAVIELRAGADDVPQSWSFSIKDAPRKIDFSHSVPDTCEPTLEKP